MSAISNLTLADGQSTPANHTFYVLRGQSGSEKPAEWVEKTSTIFAGFLRLTQLVRRSNGNNNTKVTAKLVIPQTVTIDGVSSVASTCYVNIDVTIPDNAPASVRADVVAYIKGFTANAVFADAVKDASPAF